MHKNRKINLQLHAEGDSGSEEFIEFKDPVNNQVIKLPPKIGDQDTKVLLGHIISGSRKHVQTELEAKYSKQQEELRTLLQNKDITLEEVNQKLQKFEDEKLSVEERAKKEAERIKSTYDSKLTDAEKRAQQNYNLFAETKIDNDIYSAFAGHKLYNPEQTKLLLKQMGQASIKEENGKYITSFKFIVDGVEKEMSPKDAVGHFLAQPENAHHLASSLLPGSGTQSSGKRVVDGKIAYLRSDLQNPAIMKEFSEKRKKGEPVTIIE